MKWFRVGMLVLFATGSIVAEAQSQRGERGPNSLEGFERRQGYVLLFDGETLEGWQSTGSAEWTVDTEDAALTAAPGSEGILATTESYRNFHMELDFLVEAGASSVVYLRIPDGEPPTPANSWAIPITGGDAEWATGSIIDVEPASQNVVPVGEWANLDILSIGGIVTIMIDDITVVDIESDLGDRPRIGPMAFAAPSDGTVKFRTIRLLPL